MFDHPFVSLFWLVVGVFLGRYLGLRSLRKRLALLNKEIDREKARQDELIANYQRRAVELENLRIMVESPRPWPHTVPQGIRDPKGAS